MEILNKYFKLKKNMLGKLIILYFYKLAISQKKKKSKSKEYYHAYMSIRVMLLLPIC